MNTDKKFLYHYQGSNNLLEDISDKNEQKKLIGAFLRNSLGARNLVIFMGSGCSLPAVPLMKKTMSKVMEDNNTIVTKVQEYKDFDDISEFGDIEGFLSWLQNGMNYLKDDEEKKRIRKIYNEVKKEFIESIPVYGDEVYQDSLTKDTYTSFYELLFQNRNSYETNKLSIFTTNYDLFNEISLENNNILYTTGFTSNLKQEFDINQFKYRLVDGTDRYKDKWQLVNKEANIFKLHGSINWIQDDNGSLYQSIEKKKSENVVIYPTILKHQETAQTPYSELFREFSNCLQKPNTTMIVMGYGFPDEHINNIISQNLKNQDFNLIIFTNLKEENAEKFRRKFENKVNLHIIGGYTKDSEKGPNGHHFSVIVNEYLKSDALMEDSHE